jgi:Ca-activated chloride channel family protein
LQQLQYKKVLNETQKPVLVLLTDADRSSRDIDPSAVAGYIHQQGYRLYVIGIGTSSYEAKEDDSTDLIYQPVNFSLLEDIAAKGGGGFYWAENVGSLKNAIQNIQMGERKKTQSEAQYITISLYQWPLLAGLLLIVVMQSLQGLREMGDG